MPTEPSLYSSEFRLFLLGPPRLEGPDGLIGGPVSQRHRIALLALLALAPGQRMSREKLVGMLWPETDEVRARDLLNSAVHVIRKGLAETVLASEGDGLRLDPKVLWIDLLEFQAAVRESANGRATELHVGPLLDGLSLPDAVEFDQWVDRERDRVSRLYHQCLENLAQAAAAAGDHAESVRRWRERLACTPTDGAVVTQLMSALADSGNRAGALEVAATYTRLMREEYNAEPDPQIERFIDELRRSPASVAVPVRKLQTPSASPPHQTSAIAQPPATPVKRRLAIVALASVLVAGTAAAVFYAARNNGSLKADRIAVAVFENRTGDPQLHPAGAMAADWITQRLALERVAEVAPVDHGVAGDSAQAHGIHQLAEATGAGLIVSGSLSRQDTTIQFKAQLVDARRDQVIGTIADVAGPARELNKVLDQLATRVVALVAARLHVTQAEYIKASSSDPPSYEAYKEFLVGMKYFGQSNYPKAIEQFEKSLELAPNFHTPLIQKISALRNAGYNARADSMIESIRPHFAQYSEADRVRLEYFSALVRSDRQAAFEHARRYTELVPDGAGNAGMTAVQANRPRDAIQILRKANPDLGMLKVAAYFWTFYAGAYHLLGKHERELKIANEGVRRFPRGSPNQARMRAMGALNRVDEIMRTLDDVHAPGSTQYRGELGATLPVVAAHELEAHGNERAALDILDRHIDWLRKRSGVDTLPNLLLPYTIALYARGRYDEAERMALALAKYRPVNANGWGIYALVAARRGNAEEAARRLAVMDSVFNDRYDGGNVTFFRARVAAVLGREKQALELLQLAIEQGYPIANSDRYCLDFLCVTDFKSLRQNPQFKRLIQPQH